MSFFSPFRNEIDNGRLHIVSLWVVIALLAVFLAWAMHGWSRAPRDITVHVPPDLSQGVSIGIADLPKPNVYAFAYYMWQQINRWPTNGEKDYPNNIYSFSPYLTPRFREELLRSLDTRGRRGELTGRSRALYQVPDAGYEDRRVDVLGDGAWTVWIDAVIEESVAGMEVKQARIRYPLRIVRYDVDRETNPWGLAFDGYSEEPTKLPDADQAKEAGS
ncbi:MAG: PFL_4703 family integrating conjugative element protein [Candidatus Sedimenticola endophacoides]